MKHTLNVSRQITVTKIALTGKLRAGKDEVAQHLYIKYGFNRIAFGDALKKEAHAVFPWIPQNSKPRALYQNFGQLMREIEPDVWIKHAERAVKGAIDFRVNTGAEKIGVVVTDLRQLNEYEWARTEGYTIIRVTAPDEVRIARAIKAGDSFVENDLVHSTELAIDGFDVDYTVTNEGTVEELKAQIDAIMAKLNA
jgi:dephospho-CoA kinase